MRQLPLLAGLLAAFTALAACGASVGTEDDVLPATDPLYAQVKAECGNNLILRVLDLSDEEAVCCFTEHDFVPKLHCVTGSGNVVANPNTAARLLPSLR